MLPKALAGVRVVDFTWVRAGPWGTRWLGALGAEVIKVEWPPNIQGRGGDYTTPPDATMDLNHRGFYNETNSCKLAATVNVRSPEGLDLVKQLIAVSDVVVENFSYGVLESWGIGYEEMRRIRPDIIYVSLSGFGHAGRDHLYNTYGPVAQALSGMTYLSGLPHRPPAGWGWSYMDDTGGLYGAMSALTALYHRQQTGQGQHVDAAQMIAGIPMNGSAVLDVTVNGRASRRPGYPPGNRTVWPGAPLLHNYRGPIAAPHNAYRTKGGGHHDWCAIACFSDGEWARLVEVLGAPDWAKDARFSTLAGRIEHQEELDRGVEAWTLTLDKYEVMERCQAAGLCGMAVQSNGDRVDNDPQLAHREWLTELEHPKLGRYRLSTAPFKMSESPAITWRHGPRVGEDNRRVFEGLLGAPHQEVVDLYDRGILWPSNFSMEPYPYVREALEAEAIPPLDLPARDVGGGDEATARARRQVEAGPLTGLRVLELAGEKGQFSGKLMADLGAEVIKIEPPGGEAVRHVGPFVDDVPHRDRSLAFWHGNTSKRDITLNLDSEDGRLLFRRLAETADVIIETLKPGYLPSLGLGYEKLRQTNPGLIMCSLTDFGQTGPWKDFATCDLVHLAAGGQMGCCGYSPEDDSEMPPIAGGGGQSGYMGAHYAHISILGALFYRAMTGKGQYIDTSIHQSAALTTEGMVSAYVYRGEIVNRQTGRHAGHRPSPSAQFPTKDGGYVTATTGSAGMTPQKLRAIAEWFDQYGQAQDLLEDKYSDPKAIAESSAHIADVMKEAIANMPADEAYHGAQQRGLTWGSVRAPDELIDDGHLNDRGFWTEVEHPELGRSFKYPGAAAIFNGSPWRISRRPPLLGEDNEAVYCGELGLSRLELAALAEAGVV